MRKGSAAEWRTRRSGQGDAGRPPRAGGAAGLKDSDPGSVPVHDGAAPGADTLRVAVVGPCASGKTTLVGHLRAHGFEARSIAQEHSQAPSLYRRNGANVLVYLDVSYAVVRRRREVAWGPERLRDEAVRLRGARRDADLVIDTDGLRAEEVLERVLGYLEARMRGPF